MKNKTILYKGNALVYVQGQNALLPVDVENQEKNCFYIGALDTNMIINDYRSPIKSLMESPDVVNVNGQFATTFNQPAWVEIRYTEKTQGLEIDLHETSENPEEPILWLGTLENNKMPAYEVEWELFKSLDDKSIAFCAFIPVQG